MIELLENQEKEINYRNKKAGLVKIILTELLHNFLFKTIDNKVLEQIIQTELDTYFKFKTEVYLNQVEQSSNSNQINGEIYIDDFGDKIVLSFNVYSTGDISCVIK